MLENSANNAASDVIDRFNSLDVGGCHVLSLSCSMHKKLVLWLLGVRPKTEAGEECITNFYELQFNRVLGGRVDVNGPPLGLITRSIAHADSELRSETLRKRQNLTYGENFAHFEVFCDHGKFDIVARDFVLTVVGKAVSPGHRGS